MGDRCTGHCCRLLTITGLSYAALQARATGENGNDPDPEAAEILPYLVHLGKMTTVEAYALLGVDVLQGTTLAERCIAADGDGVAVDYYRCRNLLANGDCGIYAERPRLCREYPYNNRPCMQVGCTATEALDNQPERCVAKLREWLARDEAIAEQVRCLTREDAMELKGGGDV